MSRWTLVAGLALIITINVVTGSVDRTGLSICAIGWPTDYAPGDTLQYLWWAFNNEANAMNTTTGIFTPALKGLYLLTFHGTVDPNSPTKTNVYASMVVGSDEVAYTYAAYSDHYESGSMQAVSWMNRNDVMRNVAYVRNGKHYTVRWDHFGFCAIFVAQ